MGIKGYIRSGLVVGLACFFLMGATARANNIDFHMPGGTGSVTYLGGFMPFDGTGIGVGTVSGIPAGPFGLACVGCTLSFETGNLVSSNATQWMFDGSPAGFVTITGAVPATGLPVPGLLLSGHFGSATVTLTGGTFASMTANFLVNAVDPTLLAFFGLPVVPNNGTITLGLNLSGDVIPFFSSGNRGPSANLAPPSAFKSTSVLSGDVRIGAVPEPATIMLLGPGVLGFGFLVRRSRKRAVRMCTSSLN